MIEIYKESTDLLLFAYPRLLRDLQANKHISQPTKMEQMLKIMVQNALNDNNVTHDDFYDLFEGTIDGEASMRAAMVRMKKKLAEYSVPVESLNSAYWVNLDL